MYISMYVYIHIYTYIYTWTRALTRLVPVTTRVATVSNEFVWRLPGAHHPAFWVPTAHLRFLVWRFKRLAFGPGRFFREVRKKRTMTYGPIWSQKWWEMVPDTHPQKSHGPMSCEKWSQHLSECQHQSTNLSTWSINHGRYRRSIRIHLRENTVDIDGRYGFTYRELRSIVDGGLKSEIILWSISSTTPLYFLISGWFGEKVKIAFESHQ